VRRVAALTHRGGPTEIQCDYRTLLDRAKDTSQEVLDSDGELLVIQTKGVADFQRHLQAQVAETARFVAIFNEHRDVSPVGMGDADRIPLARRVLER
jgi:hypothetical protein